MPLNFTEDFSLLALIRMFIVLIVFLLIVIAACTVSIFRPMHRNNVYFAASRMGRVSKLLGLELEVRIPDSVKNLGPVVYIANHQNSFDIFTVSAAVQPHTVSVGKKSLKWIPFFGQMYWLTGNILIDRNNSSKAMDTISQTASKIKERDISVWLFPEGTRSNGKGLLPFKTGAFRTAAMAKVPVVPICISNLHEKIRWNRWNNGKLIIELMPPIDISDSSREGLRDLTNSTRTLMANKLDEISREVGEPYPVFSKKRKQG